MVLLPVCYYIFPFGLCLEPLLDKDWDRAAHVGPISKLTVGIQSPALDIFVTRNFRCDQNTGMVPAHGQLPRIGNIQHSLRL